MDYAASNSSELKVFFAKSRSPTRRSTEEADRLREDILQPLVAGDEFEEEEFEGNTDIFFSIVKVIHVTVSALRLMNFTSCIFFISKSLRK